MKTVDSTVAPKIVWMSNDPVLHADQVQRFEFAAKAGEPIAMPGHPGLWRITSIEVNGPNRAVHAVPVGGRLRSATTTHGAGIMAKGQQRGNREARKPKKEKPKTIAAAPSTKSGQAPLNVGKQPKNK